MEQAQEQVQNIQIDADSQQNRRRHRILRELDPLDIVDDEAAEESYAHQSDDKRQRAAREGQAKM